jgi:hypothetical protein
MLMLKKQVNTKITNCFLLVSRLETSEGFGGKNFNQNFAGNFVNFIGLNLKIKHSST